MFCTGCGATLKPGVRFCNLCGKPVPPASVSPDAIPAPSDALADTVVENAPVSPIAPPAPSPVLSQAPIFSTTSPQAETQIHHETELAVPAYETHPTPASPPRFEPHGIEPERQAADSGFWANNKVVLLTGVAVLGLVAGGLAYWFLLRKPAMNGAPSGSSISRPAAATPNKPSALETATPSNSAAGQQSPAQPQNSTATEPKKEDANGVSPAATAVPASGASTSPALPGLSGKWHGEYTNHDANVVIKVTLQIKEDNSPDRLTGTLMFDSEENNSASCALSGVYNPQNKFMLLNVGSCQGNPPAYFFEGKIGFSSVELTARQVFGVDPGHNSVLNISRQ